MATLDDVAAIALGLDEVTESERHDRRTWSVAGKAFAWERPYSKADVKRFAGQPYPAEPILAVAVEDLAEKEAVLAATPGSVFTIEHFTGYPAVLVELAAVDEATLRALLLDGWLAKAPSRLTAQHLAD